MIEIHCDGIAAYRTRRGRSISFERGKVAFGTFRARSLSHKSSELCRGKSGVRFHRLVLRIRNARMVKASKMPREHAADHREIADSYIRLIELPLIEAGPDKLFDRGVHGLVSHLFAFSCKRTGD